MWQSWWPSWTIPHSPCAYFNTCAVDGTVSCTELYVRILSPRVVRFGVRALGIIRSRCHHEDGTFIGVMRWQERPSRTGLLPGLWQHERYPFVSQKEYSWEPLHHGKPNSDCNPQEWWENPLLSSRPASYYFLTAEWAIEATHICTLSLQHPQQYVCREISKPQWFKAVRTITFTIIKWVRLILCALWSQTMAEL